MHPAIIALLWIAVGYGLRELQQLWAEHTEEERKALEKNAEWVRQMRAKRAARARLQQMQAKQGGNSAA